MERNRSACLITVLLAAGALSIHGCCKNPCVGTERALPGLRKVTGDPGKAAAVRPQANKPLLLFCGAGIRRPVEDVNRAFEAETGIRVEPTFTGSGCLLAQIEVAEKGDLYMPGERWYMQHAMERGRVTETRLVAHFVPVIMVQRGNPHRIRKVEDLLRPGIRIGMGEPKACAIGHFTEKLIEQWGIADAFRRNVVAHFATAPELGNAIKIGSVDACIQWDSIAALYLDEADVVAFPVTEKTSTPIDIGLLRTSTQPQAARRYMEFIAGDRGREIFKQHHFTLDLAHPTFAPATESVR